MAKTKQKKLTEAQREELRHQLAKWIALKAEMWDLEREIEIMLGRETEFNKSNLPDAAFAMDTHSLCEAEEMMKPENSGDEIIEDFLTGNSVS